MTELSFDKRAGKFALFGTIVSLLFLGIIAVSVFVIKIEGSVISPSEVISTGNNKTVQHIDGGTIKELLIENGDKVQAGDSLLTLDGQAIQAEYNVSKFRTVELEAKISRLQGLLSGQAHYGFNRLRGAQDSQKANIDNAIQIQSDLFYASRENHNAKVTSLNARHDFLLDEISALDSQVETTRRSLGIINAQLQEVAPLIAEKLVARSRQWALERELISTQEQLDSLNVQRVKVKSALSETRAELEKLTTNQTELLLAELEKAQTDYQKASQSNKALGEKLSRLVVKAPVSGTVLNAQFHNTQAVIRAGESILEIVPESSGHQLRSRVQPMDIDQVAEGQKVRLRFESFDANMTPEIWGTVEDISADRLMDEVTGAPYYEVLVAMTDEELKRLGSYEIVPGMPVTAMFRTTDRSLFSYLAKPIEQQAARAFH